MTRQHSPRERQTLSQSWADAQNELWPTAKHQAREWSRKGVHVGVRTCERYRAGKLPPTERLFRLIEIYGWQLANRLVEPVIGVSALEELEAANERKREEIAAAEARLARIRTGAPESSLLARAAG